MLFADRLGGLGDAVCIPDAGEEGERQAALVSCCRLEEFLLYIWPEEDLARAGLGHFIPCARGAEPRHRVGAVVGHDLAGLVVDNRRLVEVERAACSLTGVVVLVGQAEDDGLVRERLEGLPSDSAGHAVVLLAQALRLHHRALVERGADGGGHRLGRLRLDQQEGAGLVLLREVLRA